MTRRLTLLAGAIALAVGSTAALAAGEMRDRQATGADPAPTATQSGVPADTVRQVQQKLKTEGFDPGPVDGVLGPQTESALRDWQQSKGISASGRVDRPTLAALGLGERGAGGMPGGASAPGPDRPSIRPIDPGTPGAPTPLPPTSPGGSGGAAGGMAPGGAK
jgi:peptidoglycan hydrolase-like protein with peptidoglycan-binding domain